jgi:hypothetical protein
MKNNKLQGGFIATATVLVLMVVAISIVITVSILGIGGAQGSLALTKGETTLSFVEGCVDIALLNAKNSAAYAGGNITLTEGTCTVTINSKVANVWTVTVSTTATDYKRTIRVIFNRGLSIVITSWQEI